MNILMVVHRTWWNRKCPPFWPAQYQFLKARPDVSINVTGPGWADYNEEETLPENVSRLMPDADAVYLWRPFGIREFGGIRGAELPLSALKVSGYQDDPRAGAAEATRANLDLAIYHDLWDASNFTNVPSVYIPLGVDFELFKDGDRPHASRNIEVSLTGNQDQLTYPLRARYRRIIRSKMAPGRIRPPSKYRYNSLTDVDAEQKKYAEELCHARIAIVSTCPHIPLTLRKYFEAMAAGCAIVGDMPAAPPADIRRRIVEVSTRMTDEKLASAVTSLLNDPLACEQQGIENRVIAQNYSYEKFAERWVAAVQEKMAARCTST